MTVTRSRTGATPRRPENSDFVETPTRAKSTRGRKSASSDTPSKESPETNGTLKKSPRQSNGTAAKSPTRSRKATSKSKHSETEHTEYEFGGPIGVTFVMIGFPLIMYYMWVGATYYDGKLPLPTKGQSIGDFLQQFGHLVYTGAFPHLKAWAMYWVFFVFEMICYLYMPGVWAKGKPLPHLDGKHLDYYCSAQTSWYLTMAVAAGLHFSGLFPLYTIIDEFGPLMSVAILSGILVSIVAYVSAFARGATHRMSGNHVYDFFMGAELNPRLFKWLDWKMFFEVRIPWYILFLTTLGGCARQYEQYGYVSGEMGFLLMAHFLYANACSKGEELITSTWDMYFEKWGFMLIFWNMAGVPLSYCHCTIYLANHHPSKYHWPTWFLVFLYVTYLFAYWVWDTCGSQKNYFRAQQHGLQTERFGFPKLPFRIIENPETIPVPGHDPLLCDGWYKYARKPHYTCDTYFAICWGLITGFDSPFPWFYPVFFCIMIAHRALRDIQRCRARYGKAWLEFERRTPYLFIPYVL